LERTGRTEMWLWKFGSPIALRLMGKGGRKSSKAASRKNASLNGGWLQGNKLTKSKVKGVQIHGML